MTLPRFIDASAGTGKTHALAWCYLEALAGARDPEGVVACTFTVAATAEFRERVRSLLAMPDDEFGESARRQGAEVSGLDRSGLLARLPALEIRTLDSLFLRLLQKVAPGTTARLPTPAEEAEAFSAAVGRWMEEDPARVARLGRPQAGSLGRVLRAFVEGAEGYPEEEVAAALTPPGATETSSWQAALVAEASSRVERALAALPGSWRPTPRSADRVEAARRAWEAWQEDRVAHAGALAKALGELARAVTDHGDLPLAALPLLESARASVRQIDGLVPEEDPRRLPADLLAAARHYRDALAERGLLGPAGVAVRLARALEGGEGLGDLPLEWILVDEYQDTSPVQGRALEAVLRASSCGYTVVGDEKQAIYRFRGASTGPFRRARERVGEEGRARLFDSWRTGPDLLAAVNWLMAPHLAGLEGATLAPDPRAPAASSREPVPLTVWAHASPGERQDGSLARTGDPQGGCGAADRAVDAVAWLAAERPGESVLVLGHSWEVLAAVARRLGTRGLPVRTAGYPRLLSDPDVADLGFALAALAWPEDPVSSLAVLRGPAFAFTVGDIERDGDEVREARDALAAWAAQAAGDRPVSAVLAELVASTGWLEGYGAAPRAHERRLRVLAALEWLREAEASGSASGARGLAAAMAEAEAAGHRVHAPAPGAPCGGITVRTVHGAKGLQADHVVVVEPERGRLGDDPPTLPDRQSRGEPAPGRFEADPEGRLGGLWLPLPRPGVPVWQSHGFRDAWEAGREEDRREKVNLAYVALTRARLTAHLVVPGLLTRRDQAPGGLLAPLLTALDPELERTAGEAAGSPAREARVPIPAERLAEVGAGAGEAAVAYVPASLRRASAAVVFPEETEAPPPATVEVPEEPPATVEDKQARLRGDWAHRALEAAGAPAEPGHAWRETAGMVPLAGAAPGADLVGWLAERVAALGRQEPWRRRAQAWEESWAEYPLPGAGGPLRCDLLARSVSGLEVVDWKTGPRTEDRATLAREQVDGYLTALGRALAGTDLAEAPASGVVVWLDEDPPLLEET